MPYRLDVAREGVAGLELPRVEAGLQPVSPLLGGAVREGLRVDPALGLLLDAVVANRRGGSEALLEIAALEQAAVVCGASPDAGQAIRLELEADRELIGVIRVGLALIADLLLDAELLLDVVPDLVGEHVGLREVARRLEPPVELVEEAEVDIDPLVERAVEGAGLRAGEPAAGVDLPAEEHELRLLVGLAGRLKLLAPEPLSVVEDERDELDLVLLVRALRHRGLARPALGHLREGASRPRHVEATAATSLDDEEVDDDRDDHPDHAAASAHATHRDREPAAAETAARGRAAAVLDVPARLAGLPLHPARTLSAPKLG